MSRGKRVRPRLGSRPGGMLRDVKEPVDKLKRLSHERPPEVSTDQLLASLRGERINLVGDRDRIRALAVEAFLRKRQRGGR